MAKSSGTSRGNGTNSNAQGAGRDRPRTVGATMRLGVARDIRGVLTNPRRIDKRSQGIRRTLRSVGAQR